MNPTEQLIQAVESVMVSHGKHVHDLREAVTAVREAEKPQPTPPALDFGEPCKVDDAGNVWDHKGEIICGRAFVHWKRRACDCVNALAGVRNPRAVADLIAKLHEDMSQPGLGYGPHFIANWLAAMNAEPGAKLL